jgi:hypothetical protein
MSEYQYYEFQTVDHRLTEREMQELRAYSTRARITPTSFINEYNFGSFKGNPDALMEKYFDGFLYLANWGTRELQLAVPSKALPAETARHYCCSQTVSAREKAGKVILSFLSEKESDGEWLEGDGQLSSLLQIRNELAEGHLRSLYLGWLMGVEACEVGETETEPSVPPNLHDLSGPQAGLADFFGLDPDLLAVAARTSARASVELANRQEMASWVASLPVREKDEILVRLMTGEGAKPGLELRSRFRGQRKATDSTVGVQRRTVCQLLADAEAHRQEREQERARKAAIAKADQERLSARIREKHLDSLNGRGETIWASVETLAATRQPKSSDQAVQHLRDLRDLAEREGRQAAFKQRVGVFWKQHAAKRSLIDRLAQAGF